MIFDIISVAIAFVGLYVVGRMVIQVHRNRENEIRRRVEAKEAAMHELIQARRAARMAVETSMCSVHPDPTPVAPADDPCAECGKLYAMSDDYLCPDCRAKMDA